jgi:hypothetical protein
MRSSTSVRTSALLATLVLTGCQGLDLAPVTGVLDASVALGLASSVAMTSIAGEGPDCATFTPACSSAPCVARVEVAVNDACPLALGAGASGTIILDGDWADVDTATFVPDLGSLDLGVDPEGRVTLGLGIVVVSRSDDEVSVVFSEQGVDADSTDGGSSAGLDQQAYTVEVSLAGTPADPTDDVLDISGGNQELAASGGDDDAAAVSQLAIAGVRTDPGCRSNPVDGTATMNEVGDGELSQTTLQFHEDCDGEVDVIASTADPTRIGRSVELGYAP